MEDKGFIAIFQIPTTNIRRILLKDRKIAINDFTVGLSKYNVFSSVKEAKKSAIKIIDEENYNMFDVLIYDLAQRKVVLKKNHFSKEWKPLNEEEDNER